MADEERTRDEVLLADVADGSEITDIRTWTEKLLADAAAGEETRPDARERIDLFINEIDGSGGGGGGGFSYGSLLPYLAAFGELPYEDLEDLFYDVLAEETFAPIYAWFVSQGASQTSPNTLDSEAAILACAVMLACFFQNMAAFPEASTILGSLVSAESVGSLYIIGDHLIAASTGMSTMFDNVVKTARTIYSVMLFGVVGDAPL